MQAKDRKITELVGQKDLTFIIPSYQRNYKWQYKNEVSELLNDLIEFVKDYKIGKRTDYFLGSVVVKIKPGLNPEYILVDGQQRITTFLLIASAIYAVIKENDSAFKYKIEGILETEEKKFKLKRIHDEHTIQMIIEGRASQLTDEQKNTSYFKVFNELYKEFSAMKFEDLEELYEKGISKLVLAVISLDGNEDEFLVFESINSKGQALSSADLIKNYLMMQIPSEDAKLEDYFENEILKNFDDSELLDFYRQVFASVTGKLSSKSGKRLYYDFKLLWPKEEINVSFFNELMKHSLIWKYIHSEEFGKESYPIKNTQLLNYYSILHNLVLNNSRIENDKLIIESDKNIRNGFKALSLVSIKRMLYGRGRVESNRTFASLSPLIIENDWNTIDSIIDELEKIQGNARTPSWEEINDKLLSTDLYSSNASLLKWVLIAIEEDYSMKRIDTSTISVEHIYPQDPSEDWDLDANEELTLGRYLNTLGNLSITRDNSALGNKTFEEKKKILSERSYLKINKSIYEIENWNSIEVEKRSSKLIKDIKRIWR